MDGRTVGHQGPGTSRDPVWTMDGRTVGRQGPGTSRDAVGTMDGRTVGHQGPGTFRDPVGTMDGLTVSRQDPGTTRDPVGTMDGLTVSHQGPGTTRDLAGTMDGQIVGRQGSGTARNPAGTMDGRTVGRQGPGTSRDPIGTMDGRTVGHPKYHGLLNQGSTCYLNSVLQVLFMTKDFRQAVKRYSCETPCIDSYLTALFDDLEERQAYTFNITRILEIDNVSVQGDAAECFEKILSRLATSEASQLFQGHLTYKNKCTTCGTETNTDDPFWSLPLQLVEDDKQDYSVVSGIKAYFTPSDVTGPNQIYCEICDAKSDATIKFEMSKHPEVLTLLLKRFKFDYKWRKYVKSKCSVEIPYTLQIPEDQTYELYAFVDHFGELRDGHYTVTIRSQDDDQWYNFNDTFVTQLGDRPSRVDDNMRSQSAYLLFYRKMPAGYKSRMPIPRASKQDARNINKQHEYAGRPTTESKMGEEAGDVSLVNVERQEDSETTLIDISEEKDEGIRDVCGDKQRGEKKRKTDVKVDQCRTEADKGEQAGKHLCQKCGSVVGDGEQSMFKEDKQAVFSRGSIRGAGGSQLNKQNDDEEGKKGSSDTLRRQAREGKRDDEHAHRGPFAFGN